MNILCAIGILFAVGVIAVAVFTGLVATIGYVDERGEQGPKRGKR